MNRLSNVYTFIYNNHPTLYEIPYDEFLCAVKDWEIYQIHKNNQLIGAVVLKGNEAHVIIRHDFKGKWFSRRIFRETIGKQLKLFGNAVTSAYETSPNLDFIRRLGYKLIKTEKGINYYEIKEDLVYS